MPLLQTGRDSSPVDRWENPSGYWRDGFYGHPFSDLIRKWFDPKGYLEFYPDLLALLTRPHDHESLLYHFVNTGFYERRIYNPQLLRTFDADYYRSQLNGEAAEFGDGKLQAHWLYEGIFRGLAGSEATGAAFDSPFQVFNIGRVGSHSIVDALAKSGIANVIHTHSDFEFSHAYRGCCLTFSQLMEVKLRIQNRPPVFVISGVRDPVGWLLSVVARLTDRGEFTLKDLSPLRLTSQLRSQVRFMLDFFGNALLSRFEVFSRGFDAKVGLGVYASGRNKLLIYRVDRLAGLAPAIGKMLGLQKFEIPLSNRSSGVIDRGLADSIWKMLFEDGFADTVLASDYVRQFFESDEQEVIADRLYSKSFPASVLSS